MQLAGRREGQHEGAGRTIDRPEVLLLHGDGVAGDLHEPDAKAAAVGIVEFIGFGQIAQTEAVEEALRIGTGAEDPSLAPEQVADDDSGAALDEPAEEFSVVTVMLEPVPGHGVNASEAASRVVHVELQLVIRLICIGSSCSDSAMPMGNRPGPVDAQRATSTLSWPHPPEERFLSR